MASVKVMIRKNKMKVDGTCPIILKISNNRCLTEKFIGHAVKPEDWDEIDRIVKKTHPNSVRINHLILKKITELSSIILDADNNDLHLTKKQIKHKVKHQNKSSFISGKNLPRLSTKVSEPIPFCFATLKSSAPKLGAM